MSDSIPPHEDSPFDLGVPTELESYQHQCLMLVDELHEAWADIRRLKGDARTLVAMNDALMAEVKALKARARQIGLEKN
ncbi:hypothetical protein ACIPL1_28460 [Pseudomonas sp. NPDC090202]|uniref:hypothetical protein n=1 Tax=unclassified Pseudomonas TaxID=196821 RepID=UPI0038009160